MARLLHRPRRRLRRGPPLTATPTARTARTARTAGAALAAGALLAAGCSGPTRHFSAPPPLPTAPEPAVSPPVNVQPAGRLVGTGDAPEGVAATASGIIAISVRGSHPGIDLVDRSGNPVGARFVPLPGEARHLALAGPDGPLLVPVESADVLDVVDLKSGETQASYPTGRQPHDATSVAGRFVVSDELANTLHVIGPTGRTLTVPAPLQPGGLATEGNDFVVVGVRARVIAAYRSDGKLVGEAASGSGPTHVVAGPGGYLYVVDTIGDTILVYRLSGSRLDQVGSIPVGLRPYGLAADPARGWVFVTVTGQNRLLGLKVSAARVLDRRSWPTGRQPNSVAYDSHDNLLAVTVTAANEIELIPGPTSGPAG